MNGYNTVKDSAVDGYNTVKNGAADTFQSLLNDAKNGYDALNNATGGSLLDRGLGVLQAGAVSLSPESASLGVSLLRRRGLGRSSEVVSHCTGRGRRWWPHRGLPVRQRAGCEESVPAGG